MRKMQEILIPLISGSMFLFWVVMLRLGSCLHFWPRSQLATGYPIYLTGHSFSNFSSGYTKYACRHSTSWFGNTFSWSCVFILFLFFVLGTILHWPGTLREYKWLCQVLSFSLLIHQQLSHINLSSLLEYLYSVVCYLPVTTFLMQIRDLLVGHICVQIYFYLFSPGSYNCLSELWCLLTDSVSEVTLFIVTFRFADSSFSCTDQYNCATPWFAVFLAWFCIKGLVDLYISQ